MQFKRKFAILAVPAVLALAGGAVVVHAANTPTPSSPASSQNSTAPEAPEAPEAPGTAAAAETADPAGDPAGDVQGGHNDTAANADHQFEGNE